MENKDIKREKAMKRFMASKALKKKHVEQMVQYMKKIPGKYRKNLRPTHLPERRKKKI